MTRFLAAVLKTSRALQCVAGAGLVFLMALTIADVLLRQFRMSIPGTYELVGYAGGIAIGLAMPFTSWIGGHVCVDSFVMRLPRRGQLATRIATRMVAAALFVVLGWNLILYGNDLRAAGEVSPTLQIHFYPVAYGLSIAAFVQTVVLLCDTAMTLRGKHE